jgi:hypothetical protein
MIKKRKEVKFFKYSNKIFKYKKRAKNIYLYVIFSYIKGICLIFKLQIIDELNLYM